MILGLKERNTRKEKPLKEASFSAHESSISNSLPLKRYDYLIGFLLRSALVGVVAGVVGVLFRLALTEGETWRQSLLAWAHSIPGGWGFLVLPGVGALAGALAGYLTGFAPETSGSGIPHVEAVLGRQRRMVWWRVIPVKFMAGALAIGSGLSLGREGPTVQMGAAAGQAVSKSLMRTKTEELQLIACGAGAGLAAAFNAPLAGVIFVLEELRRNFSPYVLVGTLVASITADLITQGFLGPLPTFRVERVMSLSLETLPLFVVLGLLTGILGVAFNKSLLTALNLAERFEPYPRWARAMVIAFAVGLVGYFLPFVLGGGHILGQNILGGKIALSLIPLIFIAKFVLTMVSYSSGVPGGIFLPLLVLGALLGSLVGQVGSVFLPNLAAAVPFFAVTGMAAFFVAVVRSPLTGIILTLELTGTYQHMLPLLIACLLSYLVAEAMNSLPVYDMLLERDLTKDGKERFSRGNDDNVLVLERVVESGSPACGCAVKDLALPNDCLLVAVNRGSREIIPRGNTRLLEGDQLTIIVPDGRAAEVLVAINQKTCCQFRE